MATTGYFEQQAGGNSYQQKWALRLEYSYDTNAAGTVTTITWTLKVYDGTGESWNGDGSAYYWITAWSGNQYLSYHYTGVGWYTLGSFTDTYSRTPGEARTITADAAWYSGLSSSYTPGSISLSESLTFPAVAGATTPTIGAVTLGSAATISLPRVSGAFTHTLTYAFGNAAGTIATGAGASCTWTPPLSLASQIPNAVSGAGTITCDTYNGSTLIGSKSISFAASVPASVVPTIGTCTVSPVNANTWINGKGIYVVGYTKARVQTSAAGAYGSTIRSVDVSLDGRSYTGADITSELLQTTGSLTASITVTDTRGRTATTTRSITVLAYSSPAINSLAYQRGSYSGGVWAANGNGEDIKVTFTMGLSLAAYSNVGAITASCTGEDSQTTSGAAAGAKTYYFTTIGVDNTRTVTISVTDSVGVTASKTMTVATVEVPLNIDAPNNRIAIGGVAEKSKVFQCKWPMELQGNPVIAHVIDAGWSNGWYYHKWSTGWVEAWCQKLYTDITIGTAWGNLFESNDVYILPTIGVSFTNFVRYTVECAGSSCPLISVNVVSQLDPATGNIPFCFSSATMQSGVSTYVVGHVIGY